MEYYLISNDTLSRRDWPLRGGSPHDPQLSDHNKKGPK